MTAAAHNQRVKPIPEDYPRVTPYVPVAGAAQFIEFLERVFGATERTRFENEDGSLGHAEVQLGDSVIMTFDTRPDWPPARSYLSVYVEDADAVHQRALEAGATEVTRLSNNFYGDRGSRFRDPFGNVWWIQSRVEQLSEDEMAARLSTQRYLDDLRDAEQTLDREMKSGGWDSPHDYS